MRDKNPEPGMRRCSACEQVKPVGEFAWANRRERIGICKACAAVEARERRLVAARADAAKAEALSRARLTFVLLEGDDALALACSSCRRPFVAGDHVAGETELAHVDCGVA